MLGNTSLGTEGGGISGNITSGLSSTQTLTVRRPSDLGGGNTLLSSAIGSGASLIALNVVATTITTLSGSSVHRPHDDQQPGTLNVAHRAATQNSTSNISNNNGLEFSVPTATMGGLSGSGNFTLPTTNLDRQRWQQQQLALPGHARRPAGDLTKTGTGALTLTSGERLRRRDHGLRRHVADRRGRGGPAVTANLVVPVGRLEAPAVTRSTAATSPRFLDESGNANNFTADRRQRRSHGVERRASASTS